MDKQYGENYYRVKELAGQYTDAVIARTLSISRERVRQLRIRSGVKAPYDHRQCSECGEWFKPIRENKASKFRSTCGCKSYR